jgi:hypothetical protein
MILLWNNKEVRVENKIEKVIQVLYKRGGKERGERIRGRMGKRDRIQKHSQLPGSKILCKTNRTSSGQ